MDPVSTLGVVAAVLQFVQFSSGLFKGAYSIYKITQGSSLEPNSLDTIHGRLQGISSNLAQLAYPTTCSRNERRLYDLAASCHEDCNALIIRLDNLRSKSGPRAVWSSFREALKESFNKREDSLRQLHERVKQYESSITLHICAVLMDNGEHLQRQLHDLKANARDSVHDTKLRHLESHGTQLRNIDSNVSKIMHVVSHMIKEGPGSRPAEEVHEVERLAMNLQGLSMKTRDLDRVRRVLDSLDYSQRPTRHGTIPEAHRKTFSWALREPAAAQNLPEASHREVQVNQGKLHQWLKAESGIFWVSGKPGSGKSTFMKFIAGHSRTKKLLADWAEPEDVILVSHYFWSPGTPMQRSQQGLWRSLLLGLLRQLPDLVCDVCPDQWSEAVEHGSKDSSTHEWTSTQLQECLRMVADLDPRKLPARICVFIDGLDEFDGDHLDMVETLMDLSRSPIFKLCVSSRPWNVFETIFGQTSPKIYMQDLTQDDILNYTRSRLATHPAWSIAVANDIRQGELLISETARRTQGVFLWVFLVTKQLRESLSNEDTFDDLQSYLHSVPPDLEEFFKGILNGVSNVYHEKMAGFLQIAVSAEEPYSFLIYHFHEIEYRDTNYAINAPVDYLKKSVAAQIRSLVKKRLDALTKGILEISQDDTVEFIHRTVKDWLMTAPMTLYLKSKVAANFNEPLALLRAYLAWFKQPYKECYDSDLWDMAERGACYASSVYELNEVALTVAAEAVLDGFVSTTVKLWQRKMSQHREKSPWDELVNNIRLLIVFFQAGLWGYIGHKLEETPDFLTKLIDEKPGSVELEQLEGIFKEAGKSLLSEVRSELLGLLMTLVLPASWLLDTRNQHQMSRHSVPDASRTKLLQATFRLIRELEIDPDSLVCVTAEPKRRVALWIYIFLCPFSVSLESIDQVDQQGIKDTLEVVMGSLDRDYYTLSKPVSVHEEDTVWDVFCDLVRNLKCSRGPTANFDDNMAVKPDFQAEALGICIAKLSCTGRDFPWDKLRTAIESGFHGESLKFLLSTMDEHNILVKKETWAAQWKRRSKQGAMVERSRKRTRR